MSNWICKECGANYIDVNHQEPSVLKQELEVRELKNLLEQCRNVLLLVKDGHDPLNCPKYGAQWLIPKLNEVLGEKK